MSRNHYRSLIFILYLTSSCFSSENPVYNCSQASFDEYTCKLFNITHDHYKVIPHHQQIDKIYTVHIQDSKFETLTSDVCEALPYLEAFKAFGTGLKTIDQDAFAKCTKLMRINLMGNQLESLPLGVFDTNKDLSGIWLISNRLTDFNWNLVTHNPNLIAVVLDKNQIQKVVFPEKQEFKMEKLKFVSIRFNKLTNFNIPRLIEISSGLEEIHLGGNPFECSNLRVIIDVLEVKNIRFDGLGECIENGIQTSIETTPTFYCTIIDEQCSLSNVTLTSEKKNFKLIRFRHPSQIEQISFEDTTIEILTKDVCYALPYLRNFTASQLGLTTIEQDAFRDCTKLIEIDLSGNSLTTLPLGVFDTLENLKKIWANYNSLTEFNWNLFDNNHQLRFVNLAFNQIDTMVTMSKRMEKLVSVDLTGNKLKSFVDVDNFIEKCPKLAELQLTENNFSCAVWKRLDEILKVKGIEHDQIEICPDTIETVPESDINVVVRVPKSLEKWMTKMNVSSIIEYY